MLITEEKKKKRNKTIAREYFESRIESGQIESQRQLKKEIADKGWQVSLYGEGFITIKTPSFRFRLRFDFGDLKGDGWIYALIAHSKYEKACYVGSSVNFQFRMQSHLDLLETLLARRTGTSTELFLWAFEKKLTVNVIVLEKVLGLTKLVNRETLWTAAAKNAEWILPGAERWGCKANKKIAQSPLAASLASMSPPNFASVNLSVAKPLSDVVRQQINPKFLLTT